MNTPLPYSNYLIRILTASVYDVAVETPLEPARSLSVRLKNNILLKREDLQPVFSFKIRGAYNKMSKLPKDALACGVIAASAAIMLKAWHCPHSVWVAVPLSLCRKLRRKSKWMRLKAMAARWFCGAFHTTMPTIMRWSWRKRRVNLYRAV